MFLLLTLNKKMLAGFIVNFEDILNLFLELLLLNLN